jgi:hypothetical protein
MKIVVKMKWVRSDDKWHLITPNGHFLYDLFDCENMMRLFDNPDKDKEELFVIDAHRLSEGKEKGDK